MSKVSQEGEHKVSLNRRTRVDERGSLENRKRKPSHDRIELAELDGQLQTNFDRLMRERQLVKRQIDELTEYKDQLTVQLIKMARENGLDGDADTRQSGIKIVHPLEGTGYIRYGENRYIHREKLLEQGVTPKKIDAATTVTPWETFEIRPPRKKGEPEE